MYICLYQCTHMIYIYNMYIYTTSGVDVSKGMRVRKSRTRLEYVRANGWDDLSDGADGVLISLLVRQYAHA